jgi:ribosome-associated protein
MMKSVEEIKDLAVNALEDLKAVDLVVIDVRGKTSVSDYMVIASGTSDRHVKSMANNVIVEAKKAGINPLGIEGDKVGEWVLVDLADVIVHIMLPQTRDFYQLEKLWETQPAEMVASAKA